MTSFLRPLARVILGGRTPVGAAAEEFAGVIRRRCRGTRKAWKTDISRLRAAVDLLGAKHVEEITPQDVARMMNEKEAGGARPKTVNAFREIVSRFCTFLIRERGVVFRETGRTSPALLIPRRREADPEISYLTVDELEALLEALSPHPALRVAAALMGLSGLRRGEVVWLLKEDADIGRRLVTVRPKTVAGRSWQPKTGRSRAVPVSDRLLQELERWRSPAGTPWYVPSPLGVRYDEDNLSTALREAQSGRAHVWNSLGLRHTFGTQLARRGVSLYKIATLMGNSPEIVRRHYALLVPEELREEVEFAAPAETAAASGRGDAHGAPGVAGAPRPTSPEEPDDLDGTCKGSGPGALAGGCADDRRLACGNPLAALLSLTPRPRRTQ